MAASETEFPLSESFRRPIRALLIAQRALNPHLMEQKCEPSIEEGRIVRHARVIDHSTGCKSDATV